MFFRPMSHTHACRTGHRQDGSQQQGANPRVYRPAGSGRNPMQWRAPDRAMPGHHKEMMQILHAGLRPMRPAPEPEPPPPTSCALPRDGSSSTAHTPVSTPPRVQLLLPSTMYSNVRTLTPSLVHSNNGTQTPSSVYSNVRMLTQSSVYSKVKTLTPSSVYSDVRILTPSSVYSNV